MLRLMPGSVAVVNGASSTWGVVDHMEAVEAFGAAGADVLVDVEVVRVATGKIGTLANDAAITVGGVAREVAGHHRIDDGEVTVITLGA
jgi:hypothetical protein